MTLQKTRIWFIKTEIIWEFNVSAQRQINTASDLFWFILQQLVHSKQQVETWMPLYLRRLKLRTHLYTVRTLHRETQQRKAPFNRQTIVRQKMNPRGTKLSCEWNKNKEKSAHFRQIWCIQHLNMSIIHRGLYINALCGQKPVSTHALCGLTSHVGTFSRSPQGKLHFRILVWVLNVIPLTSMVVDFLAGLPTLLDAVQLYAPPSSTVTAGMVSVPPWTTLLFGSSSPPSLTHFRVGGGSPPDTTHTRVIVSPGFTTKGSSRRSLMEGWAEREEGDKRGSLLFFLHSHSVLLYY